MSSDHFQATFRIRLDRESSWKRLTEHPGDSQGAEHLWLPGFDAQVSVVEAQPPGRLRATKDEEPCAGTDIVITLEDDGSGTRIHVVQSRFGDWLPAAYDFMAIGWKYIIADLQTYLATAVHPRRFLRAWGDLGADVAAVDGAIELANVRPGGLAEQLGMIDGDLVVTLADAPIASLDDLVTVLRVLQRDVQTEAEWIRAGTLMTTRSSPGP